MYHHKSSFLISLILLTSACAAEDPTKQAPIAVGIERSSIASTPTESSGADGSMVLDAQGEPSRFSLYSAEIMVRHIELDLPDSSSCEAHEDAIVGAMCEDGKITIEGPMIIDLLSGKATPDLSEVRIPSGQYKRMDIRIDDGDPDAGLIVEGDPLDDYSMVVSASFSSELGPMDLELSLKFNEDIRFDAGETGIEISGEGYGLFAALNASLWFDAETLDRCIASEELMPEDGELVVDDGEGSDCGELENDIKRRIKESGQLLRE